MFFDKRSNLYKNMKYSPQVEGKTLPQQGEYLIHKEHPSTRFQEDELLLQLKKNKAAPHKESKLSMPYSEELEGS